MTAPGVFSFSGSGTRDGAILNAVTFAPPPFSVTTNGAPTYLAIFTTGLNLSTAPAVMIGGVPVPVRFFGNAPCCAGLQQINVQLVPALAGAGRVEVAVTSGGRTSNIVEVVILPSPGQGPRSPESENQGRNRELAAIAWIPNTSLALVTDENDDVVRVVDVDIAARRVIRTIALPEGAEPAAVAVTSTGSTAVVAERDRGKVAVINLSTFAVTNEVTVGRGPGSVAIAGDLVLVANQDSDTVSAFRLPNGTVTTIPLGRAPRAISADLGAAKAYVTEQGSGSIAVINLSNLAAAPGSLNLGEDVRPQAIQVLSGLGLAVVTEPSKGPDGQVLLVNLATGAFTSFGANPDRSGGSSEIAVNGSTIYLANQTGGSVTVATLAGSPPAFTNVRTIKVDIGARALAIDAKDNLLLVTNEATGNIVLVDLRTHEVVGRIIAVRAEDEDDDRDDHDDRGRAKNAPRITSLTPEAASAGASFTLTIIGTGLAGATDVIFVADDSHGNGKGRGHGKDPTETRDAAFTVSGIQVNATGTQLAATVRIAANAARGDRVVRVLTPNGESVYSKSSSTRFTVR